MKPIKLTIKNFISYRGKPVVIDFTDYRCLFLISGNTGAGKTTIFDAMTYALFGEISAEESNTDGTVAKNSRRKCLRCENASDDDTLVELVFEHQGKEYCIQRGYTKRKDRKDGQIYYDNDFVQMKGEGMNPLDKVKKIDDKIKDMLGLDVKQWRNVVMLAQSQFMSFLKASTPERTEILNKLFDTSRFERLGKHLEEMEKSLKTDTEKDLELLSERSKSFKFSEDSEAGVEFAALNGTDPYAEAENILRIFDKALESDQKTLTEITNSMESLKKASEESLEAYNDAVTLCNTYGQLRNKKEELSALQKKKEEFDIKRHDAENAKKAAASVNPQYLNFKSTSTNLTDKKNALEEQKKKIPELEKDKARCEKERDIAKENSIEEQTLRNRAASIEPLLEKYSELENAMNSKNTLSKQVDELQKKVGSSKEHLTLLNSELTQKEAFISENQNVGQQLEAAKNEKQNLDSRIKSLQNIKNDYNALLESEKLKKKFENEIESEKNKLGVTTSTYEGLLKKQNAHSAGILAQTLQTGCKCPVCGSLDHPSPAILPDDAPTANDIEVAKNEQERSNKRYHDIDVKLATETQKYDTLKLSFDMGMKEEEIVQSDDVLIAIDSKISKVKKDQEETSKLIEKLTELQQAFNEANKKIIGMKAEIETLRKTIENDESTLRSLEKDLSSNQTLVDTLSKDLSEFNTRSEAEQKIEELNAKADQLKKALENATDAFNQANENLNLGINNITELNKDIDNLAVTEKQARDTYEKARSEAGFSNEEEFLQYLTIHKNINNLEKEISEYDDNCLTLGTTINNLNTQIAERPEPENLEEYKIHKEECSRAASDASEKMGSLNSTIGSNKKVRKDFFDSYQKTKGARSKLDMISELVNVYKGRNLGVKISFNQYVLGGYLDTIVSNATRRLKEMSCGRYALKRVDKATGTQNSNALDLDIYDYHTSHERSINTLSGGEAFMTALSLSLSISDTIQSSARGKTVEGLFIDEGFGTLDDDTRNLAVNTLKQMSNETISIGIISHVEDLKTVIEKGMEVTYNPSEGSKIRFY